MPFTSCGGCLKNIFITEAEIIDRYVGNQLWSWGFNNFGRLGNNSIVAQSSPVQTISGGTNWKQISTADAHASAIKTDGTLWIWGCGGYGMLGTNSTVCRSSPVQTVSGGTNWKQVSLGLCHSAAIKTDGTLWLWGLGSSGQLGTNAIVAQSSPVQTISGGTNWKQVSLGDNQSAAIKTDGTLWLWGLGGSGRIGDNASTTRSSPVQTISGGTNWKQVSVGQGISAAIKTDGTLWLWGNNENGALGDNTNINRSSPVQTISGGNNWKQVSSGKQNDLVGAIKTDGTLWLWGNNGSGRIGNNSLLDQSSPVQTISGGTNWKQVSVQDSPAAIKTDGSLWLWGVNDFGQLGINSVANRSSPVQTVSGGTNWKQVDGVGDRFTAAVTFTES